MEREDIEETFIEKVNRWQEIRQKRMTRWFRRLKRRYDARVEYVQNRDKNR